VFWPESDSENARQSLRQTLFILRRLLGPTWVEATPLEIRATDAIQCDAAEFESALVKGDYATAIDLYGGPFLAGVHLVNLKPWEVWVDGRRAHFARAFRKACRETVSDLAKSGDLAGAIATARRWIVPDPLDDEGQHRLMELLVLSGDRNEAIRQYESYTKMLEADGLTPLDETRALIESARSSPVQPQNLESLVLPTDVGPSLAETRSSSAFALAPAPQPAGDRWLASWLAWSKMSRISALALVVAFVTVGGLWAWRTGALNRSSPERGNSEIDAFRYMVTPLVGDSVVTPEWSETQLAHSALASLRGITIVDSSVLLATLVRRRPRHGQTLPCGACRHGSRQQAGRFRLGQTRSLRNQQWGSDQRAVAHHAANGRGCGSAHARVDREVALR
jgi:DNA-binding SARP family transcriptional activator